MPTVDDLRAALNDLAADTPGLSAADTLRAGRRLRTRRRLLTAGGAAVAVAGIALGVGLAGGGAPAPVPVPPAETASAAPRVPASDRFAWGEKVEMGGGRFVREYRYLPTPPGETEQAIVTVTSRPGGTTLPPTTRDTTRFQSVKHIRVRVEFTSANAEHHWTLAWVDHNTLFVAEASTRTTTAGGIRYGPTEKELLGMVGQMNNLG